MSKFTVVGVSTQNGITKVRFANDIVSRTKLLAKGGHSPLELIELPSAMTKAEACQYLLGVGGVFLAYSDLITDTMNKKEGTVVVKAKPSKVVKAKTKAAKVIKSKPQVEDDLEVKEIQALAA
jgi:hypothetical protein